MPRAVRILAGLMLLSLLATSSVGPTMAAPQPWPEPVPLVGERPAWITEEMHAKLLRGEVVAARAPAPIPVEPLVDQKIRPGAWMASPHWCTFNFVFRHVPTGDYGIGTAGHCVDEVGQEIWLQSVHANPDGDIVVHPPPDEPYVPNYVPCFGAGPITGHDGYGYDPVCILDETFNTTGREPPVAQDVLLVAYPIGKVEMLRNNGVGDDFALVRIDKDRDHLVDPTINGIGGPCGTYDGHLSRIDEDTLSWLPPNGGFVTDRAQSMPVLHYGHGIVWGSGGTPRAGLGEEPSPLGIARGSHRDGSIQWEGTVSGGDSGSPVRVWNGDGHHLADDTELFMDGRAQAAGVLTHRSALAGVDLVVNGWTGWGTSIARVMEMLGEEWELVDSPQCPEMV